MYKPKGIREWLEHNYGYLRFRTNWHKHPALSKAMCALGRHDYTVSGITRNEAGYVDGIYLKCFYCEHANTQLERVAESGDSLQHKLKRSKRALLKAAGYIKTATTIIAKGPDGDEEDTRDALEFAEDLKKLSEEI
jgi:hypothetical protein